MCFLISEVTKTQKCISASSSERECGRSNIQAGENLSLGAFRRGSLLRGQGLAFRIPFVVSFAPKHPRVHCGREGDSLAPGKAVVMLVVSSCVLHRLKAAFSSPLTRGNLQIQLRDTLLLQPLTEAIRRLIPPYSTLRFIP